MEEVRSTTERKGNQGDYLIKKRERGSEREREETQQMGRWQADMLMSNEGRCENTRERKKKRDVKKSCDRM